MRLLFIRRICGLSMALLATPNIAWPQASSDQWRYVQNGAEAPADQRYAYHWRVLKASLDATAPSYGPYSVAWATHMSEARQINEMQREGGAINTMVLDSTSQLERDLIPVKVPIDKGLLGYRVFLIRAQDQPHFSSVRTLEELKQFTIGQGSDWSDFAIYKAAGFQVLGGTMYENLFDMLMHKRFDAFGRGVSEVLDELDARQKKYPDMAIEESVLLYYPMPVYFWFPKSANGAARAKRVEEGMNIIVKNGTLDRMFKDYFGPVIAELKLKKRTLFRIPNPDLPPDQPFSNKAFWFDPLK